MPIKPENKKLYPKNWKQISKRIIWKRAKGRCEKCGVYNRAVGYRDEEGVFIPLQGCLELDCYGMGKTYPEQKTLSYKEAREIAEGLNHDGFTEYKIIVIVLTTAHIDHDPTNNEEGNLAAWCQKCHNNHDLPHRLETRRRASHQMKLKF